MDIDVTLQLLLVLVHELKVIVLCLDLLGVQAWDRVSQTIVVCDLKLRPLLNLILVFKEAFYLNVLFNLANAKSECSVWQRALLI